jgi:hypothetical protein
VVLGPGEKLMAVPKIKSAVNSCQVINFNVQYQAVQSQYRLTVQLKDCTGWWIGTDGLLPFNSYDHRAPLC